MKKYRQNYYFYPLKVFLFLFALAFFMLNGETFAQEKKKKKKKKSPLEFRVGFETMYDNNILKYSDKYLDRFMNGEDPGRFHIKTYDDLVLNPSLGATYTFNIFKNVNSKVSGVFSPRIYVVNSINDWIYWNIGFQQYVTKKASFKFTYSYIPDFYVRHFRDDQWIDVYGYTPITFQPYAFAKDNFDLYAQNTFFKNTRIRLSVAYARYYHNEHYTEYDSKDWYYGINVLQPIGKNFKIEAGYEYVTSEAKGYDATYETPETTTGPDATFVEDRYNIGFVWDLPRLKKRDNDFSVELLVMNRFYSSTYSPLDDPLHAGRYDHNYRVFFNYGIELSKSFDLGIFYDWLMRDTETKAKINAIYVSNEKDYRQDQMGVKVVYRFKL